MPHRKLTHNTQAFSYFRTFDIVQVSSKSTLRIARCSLFLRSIPFGPEDLMRLIVRALSPNVAG